MAHILRFGFTGACRDRIAAAYPLGNGYRWHFPALMRFNAPDFYSPFGPGGVNSYAYCAADPVNRVDPGGHMLALLHGMEDTASSMERAVEDMDLAEYENAKAEHWQKFSKWLQHDLKDPNQPPPVAPFPLRADYDEVLRDRKPSVAIAAQQAKNDAMAGPPRQPSPAASLSPAESGPGMDPALAAPAAAPAPPAAQAAGVPALPGPSSRPRSALTRTDVLQEGMRRFPLPPRITPPRLLERFMLGLQAYDIRVTELADYQSREELLAWMGHSPATIIQNKRAQLTSRYQISAREFLFRFDLPAPGGG
ncbi:RHS repeat-associated core domain-containing protein [Bordetella bronchialis]|uniref:RHS repeat-associated core domain-containing protein n=1 Tax=Bordetella bronchialis TaxID=463025 RepID=A0A193FY39_9BORD|nr:RHS repeat-associated core domain-containing protein [Bordetella bronchialis]ANN72545.1 hypothetical protein BAU08_15365 [Bordetella bronchialis]